MPVKTKLDEISQEVKNEEYTTRNPKRLVQILSMNALESEARKIASALMDFTLGKLRASKARVKSIVANGLRAVEAQKRIVDGACLPDADSDYKFESKKVELMLEELKNLNNAV